MSKTGNRKLRVGVIFGGRSGEHEVSLRSARSVMDALDRDKYDVVPIGITKSGEWLTGEVMSFLSAGAKAIASNAKTTSVHLPPVPRAAANAATALIVSSDARDAQSSTRLDVVIPILHGTFGEDGTIQGLFELANIPYVGAGVLGSAVGMDKAVFKQVMSASQIPIVPWQLVRRHELNDNMSQVVQRLEDNLPYPMFVKPANLGSSVGVSKCEDRATLIIGLRDAATYDRRIVVEQGLNIRELEVSVLGNAQPIASVVGEIRPKRDFYDYAAKYITDDSELLIPAPISPECAADVRALAIQAYLAIDCAGLARVDLMLDKDSNDLYMNEINTMPGFTSISMYPKLWEATGVPYGQLLDKLIELALDRHEEKRSLKTDFSDELRSSLW